MSKLLQIFVAFFFTQIMLGQCGFLNKSNNTDEKGLYTVQYNSLFYDDKQTPVIITTKENVKIGNYTSLQVIKGMKYNISTTSNELTGIRKRITLFDASNTSTALAYAENSTSSGADLVSITWTATFSGILYVQLNNKNDCTKDLTSTDNATSDKISFQFVGGSNTQDDQTIAGVDKWIGHAYEYKIDRSKLPTNEAGWNTSLNNNLSASYLGTMRFGSSTDTDKFIFPENFTYGFGGNSVMNYFKANGLENRFIGDAFLVKFLMKTSKSGCYKLKVVGDDGVILRINGKIIVNNWRTVTKTEIFDYVVVNLKANDVFELFYFDYGGPNNVTFDMVPLTDALNTITALSTKVCNGEQPGAISGNFNFNNTTVNPTVKYIWQSSSNPTSGFVDIANSNTKDFTPSIYNNTTANDVTVYYRRIVQNISDPSCQTISNVVSIVYSVASAAYKPVANAPVADGCKSATLSWETVPGAISYHVDLSTDTGFYNYVLKGNYVSVGGPETAKSQDFINYNAGNVTSIKLFNLVEGGIYYYRVRALLDCGYTSTSASQIIQVGKALGAKEIVGATTVCAGTQQDYASSIANAVKYVWTIPTGWTLISPTTGYDATSRILTVNTTDKVSIIRLKAPDNATTTDGKLSVIGYSACNVASTGDVSGQNFLMLKATSGTNTTGTVSIKSGSNKYDCQSNTTEVKFDGVLESGESIVWEYSYNGTNFYECLLKTGYWGPSYSVTDGVLKITNIGKNESMTFIRARMQKDCFSYSNVLRFDYESTASKGTISGGDAVLCADTNSVNMTINGIDGNNDVGAKFIWRYREEGGSFEDIQILANAVKGKPYISANNISDKTVTIYNFPGSSTNDLKKYEIEVNVTRIVYENNKPVASCVSYVTPVAIYTKPTFVLEPTLTNGTISCANPVSKISFQNLPYGRWVIKDESGKTYPMVSEPTSVPTITGVAAGEYKFAIASEGDDSCFSAFSNQVTVLDSTVTTTWDGNSWSKGAPSVSDEEPKNTIFTGDYNNSNADSDLRTCNCTVKNNSEVIIDGLHALIVERNINVESGSSLKFTSVRGLSGALVQKDKDAVNTFNGTFSYFKETGPLRNTDFLFISTPVLGVKFGDISYDKGRKPAYYYEYYPNYISSGKPTYVVRNATWDMKVGVGYMIKAPKTYTGGESFMFEYTGKPFNGDLTVNVVAGRYNLIANPYPGPIDIVGLINDNQNIDGTLYYWTNTQGKQADGKYLTSDYATCNKLGGTAAVNGTASTRPMPIIGVGQAVFAKILGTDGAASTITIKNSYREEVYGTLETESNTPKTSSFARMSTEKMPKAWLNLQNANGLFRQILIGNMPEASNDMDRGYDSETYQGNPSIDFYTVLGAKKLAIQTRAYPLDSKDEVPVGFFVKDAGTYSISVNHLEGFEDKNLILWDKLTSTEHDLKSGAYTFSTTATKAIDDRFVLKFETQKLGLEIVNKAKESTKVWQENKQVYVSSPDEIISKVTVFDINGKLLYANANVNSNDFVLSDFALQEQIVLVQTTYKSGATKTDKILVK